MCGFWNKWTNKHGSSAKVVDGSLILSLPDAINPIVWRMELGSVKASALEVRATNDNTFQLSLKTPKGEVHEIAPFDTRDKALQALMNVSGALQNAHGKMNPATTTQTGATTIIEKRGGSWKWLFAIAGILLVLYVLSVLFASAPATQGNRATNDSQSGVPIPFDQYNRGF